MELDLLCRALKVILVIDFKVYFLLPKPFDFTL